MTYKINISETLQADVVIQASNEDEAIEKAEEMYNNCDVLLTADNFSDVIFKVKEVIDDACEPRLCKS